MTLPLIHTQTITSHGSPASSEDSSLPPATPVIDSLSINTASSPTAANAKRKPSRRSNTAERRATHNAVERARRETLNSRFLDLASLLPNLSQIRRPSKSAIVNSSIALLQANDRFRLLASKELRALKGESDALRRELNEWRDRAGIPRIEEPRRGEGFGIVLGGEVDSLGAAALGAYGEEDYGEDDGFGEGYEDDMAQAQAHAHAQAQAHALHLARQQALAHQAQQVQQQQIQQQQAQVQQQQQQQQQQRPSIHIHPPANLQQAGVLGTPVVASPTQMSFDNPAQFAGQVTEFYSPTGMMSGMQGVQVTQSVPVVEEKMWFHHHPQQQHAMTHPIPHQHQQHQQMRSHSHTQIPTPPQSSHGLTPEMFMGVNAPMMMMRQRSASIGSHHSGHSAHSGGGSPPHQLQVAQGVMV